MAIETIKIPAASLTEIEGKLLESFRWSRDHKGQKYRHTVPCEWCLQQGLLLTWEILTGRNPVEERKRLVELVANEKTKKKRVIKKPTATKRVVRRKK